MLFLQKRAQSWFAKQKALLGTAAVFGLAAYLVFLLLLPQEWHRNQSTDYFVYYEPVAKSLLAGEGFFLPNGRPAVTYPPGIPLVFATGLWTAETLGLHPATAFRILEGVLVMAMAALVCAVTRKAFGWETALAASLLWSTYPFHLWLTKQPETSNPFAIPMLLAFLLFLSWTEGGRSPGKYGAATGILLGITSLMRPFSIALPLVMVILAWICRIPSRVEGRSIFSFFLLLAYAATVLPWEIWAWKHSGQWIPLSTNGPASVLDGLTLSAVRPGSRPRPAIPDNLQPLVGEIVSHAQELRSTGAIARFMVARLAEDPSAVLQLILLKAARSWYANDSQTFEGGIALIQVFYLPLIVWGGIIAWRGDRQQKNYVLVAALVTFYFWTMTVAALSIVRYMVPAFSLLMVFVGLVLLKFTGVRSVSTLAEGEKE